MSRLSAWIVHTQAIAGSSIQIDEGLWKRPHMPQEGSMLFGQREHASVRIEASDNRVRGCPDSVDGRSRVDTEDPAARGLEVLQQRRGDFVVRFQSFAYAVEVVIGAATGLTAGAQPAFQDFIVNFIEKRSEQLAASRTDATLPSKEIVEIPRKTVNEEVCLALALPNLRHCLLQQPDRDLNRDNTAFSNDAVDQLTVLGVRVLALCPETISSGDMGPAIELTKDPLALGALA